MSRRYRELRSDDPSRLVEDDDSDVPPVPDKKNPKWGRKSKTKTPNPNQVQPSVVSDRVWSLAQQWIDKGTSVWDGHRPPVNLAQFSVRLAVAIKNEPVFPHLTTEDVSWCLSWMIEHFWEDLAEGTKNTAGLQFQFLEEEWAWWVERAVVNLTVAKHLHPVDMPPLTPVEGSFLGEVESKVRFRKIREAVLGNRSER